MMLTPRRQDGDIVSPTSSRGWRTEVGALARDQPESAVEDEAPGLPPPDEASLTAVAITQGLGPLCQEIVTAGPVSRHFLVPAGYVVTGHDVGISAARRG